MKFPTNDNFYFCLKWQNKNRSHHRGELLIERNTNFPESLKIFAIWNWNHGQHIKWRGTHQLIHINSCRWAKHWSCGKLFAPFHFRKMHLSKLVGSISELMPSFDNLRLPLFCTHHSAGQNSLALISNFRFLKMRENTILKARRILLCAWTPQAYIVISATNSVMLVRNRHWSFWEANRHRRQTGFIASWSSVRWRREMLARYSPAEPYLLRDKQFIRLSARLAINSG